MIFLLFIQLRKLSILVLLINLLTSCSSTRLVYTLAGEFIQDEITYFFDLDEEEEVFLNQQVKEMVNWHRKSMLPSYATYFNDMADKLSKNQYDDSDITKVLESGWSLIEKTVTGLTPRASKFLVRHQSVEAIEYMERKMVTRQRERLEQLVELENKLYEKRLDQLISNFEKFLGTLTDAQVMLLEEHTRMTLGDSRVRLRKRTQRQKVFLEFLRTQPIEAELTTYLNKLLLSSHVINDPAYQAFMEASLNRFQALLVNMLDISSREQRKLLISKFRTYADDFEAVSK